MCFILFILYINPEQFTSLDNSCSCLFNTLINSYLTVSLNGPFAYINSRISLVSIKMLDTVKNWNYELYLSLIN